MGIRELAWSGQTWVKPGFVRAGSDWSDSLQNDELRRDIAVPQECDTG